MLNVESLTPNYLKSLVVKTIKTNKKVVYIDVESAFDIETTSTYVDNEKVAFMYVFMLGIGLNKQVFYGRTWEEVLKTLKTISDFYELNEEKRMVIYVHNLGYEFQFMRKYFDWLNVFSVSERKPIKALCSLGFEFRDSYILSGYSLANTAKNLHNYKIDKLVGNLDYSLIRTAKTKLTKKELNYCENDILIVLAYIKEQMNQYGDITKIPLTNTGRVRNFVRYSCYYSSKNHRKTSKGKYIRYRKIMGDLTIDLPKYNQLKRAFMGGFTHSSPNKTKMVIEGVDSIDFTSSYPTVMLAEKFPMSRGKELKFKTVKELKNAMNRYCLVFDVCFEGISNKIGYESYIPESKCFKLVKPTINNGRIFSAKALTITITDIDFKIIEQVYSWDRLALKNVVGYVKNYLPKSIIESVLTLYEKKTTLKDVVGQEVEYMLSKGMLNSVYGMCVTDFIKDNHVYDDEWGIEKVNPEEKIEDYNKSKTRFLYYPWGIWITAYARRNLWTGILNIKDDYVYSDTDSLKMTNYNKHINYINSYNKHITTKLTNMMNYYKLDIKRLSPKTIENKEKPIGLWDYEGHYTKFKTLGAKRYLIEQNGNYFLTVAGLSKSNGIKHIIELCSNKSDGIFKLFNDDLYIPSEKTGKMTHTYLDFERRISITDLNGIETTLTTLSSIHLENCDFTLSLSKQYDNFLKMFSSGLVYKGVKEI